MVGELILDPVLGEDVWRYEVDLDADGTIEFASLLPQPVALFYRFESPGVHPIRIRFTFEQLEEEVQREEELFVVVNDPNAVEVLTEFIFPPLSLLGGLEGIALSNNGQDLYVSKAADTTILRMNPEDLTVVDSIIVGDVAEVRTLEGLAVSTDDRKLFVVDKGGDLTTISVPDLQFTGQFSLSVAQFFVVAEGLGQVLVGGSESFSGIARVDVDMNPGEILQERNIDNGWHFAASSDGQTVAVIVGLFGPSELPSEVRLLRASDFSDIWRTLVPELFLHAVALSGDRVYVFATDEDANWLVVLDVTTGELLREFRIEPLVATAFSPGVANPAALSPDGRFVVFPSTEGAYFVDTSLDLPLFRLSGPQGCCNVTASSAENVFFFASPGSVVKARLRD